VKVVVSDGSKAYKTAIEARLGHARHVLDRFHVIRWFAAGLTAVRRDVQRRPAGSKPAFDPEVFRSRFLLMGRPDKLDAAERGRLDKLFAAHPRLKAAWDALGELHHLYLAKDRKGALAALEPTLLSGHIPSDRLVRAPDRTQADKSISRHQTSEDSSQTCTRRERTFIMSAKARQVQAFPAFPTAGRFVTLRAEPSTPVLEFMGRGRPST